MNYKADQIRIENRINMGSEGIFNPNSEMEAQLLNKLENMKNGDKELNRLISRGAVSIVEPKGEAKSEVKTAKKGTKEPEEPEEPETESVEGEEAEEEDDEVRLEATGEYYFEHYGGGNFHIVDPEGLVVDRAGSKAEATEKVEKLKEA